jgi:putative ABC transport system substrate-binding protein
MRIPRRDFITFLGGAAAAPVLASRAARAQPLVKPVIGVLSTLSASEWVQQMAGFETGLAELGFTDGRNIAIDYRWAEGHIDRMPAMAEDFIGRRVAVILASGNASAARFILGATRTIPIVFTTQTDPVAAGLVASLNRPGGNATGVTGLGAELLPKLLEIFHEMIPKATKFAVAVNPANPIMAQATTQGAQSAADRLGLEVIVLNASTENEIDRAFAIAIEQGAAGVLFGDAYFVNRREQVAALGLRYKLPIAGGTRQGVEAGALMSYAANNADFYRQAGRYVGRILKGEKPAELPVVQPTKFDLTINLKTAKAVGVDVSSTMLLRADEVFE